MTDRTSICTSFSTSSAAGSSAGASPMPTLFKALFDDTLAKHAVPPGQLTLHADRGGPMKATALMLADLGVTRSHSRPHTSNDNPFSEAHFKTLKYQPEFPSRFGCVEDAKRLGPSAQTSAAATSPGTIRTITMPVSA
jgi:transposase InsO family protein